MLGIAACALALPFPSPNVLLRLVWLALVLEHHLQHLAVRYQLCLLGLFLGLGAGSALDMLLTRLWSAGGQALSQRFEYCVASEQALSGKIVLYLLTFPVLSAESEKSLLYRASQDDQTIRFALDLEVPLLCDEDFELALHVDLLGPAQVADALLLETKAVEPVIFAEISLVIVAILFFGDEIFEIFQFDASYSLFFRLFDYEKMLTFGPACRF